MMALNAKQVAELLGVTPARVYELARLGVLPHYRLLRQVRFEEAAIEEFKKNGGATLPGGWRKE